MFCTENLGSLPCLDAVIAASVRSGPFAANCGCVNAMMVLADWTRVATRRCSALGISPDGGTMASRASSSLQRSDPVASRRLSGSALRICCNFSTGSALCCRSGKLLQTPLLRWLLASPGSVPGGPSIARTAFVPPPARRGEGAAINAPSGICAWYSLRPLYAGMVQACATHCCSADPMVVCVTLSYPRMGEATIWGIDCGSSAAGGGRGVYNRRASARGRHPAAGSFTISA